MLVKRIRISSLILALFIAFQATVGRAVYSSDSLSGLVRPASALMLNIGLFAGITVAVYIAALFVFRFFSHYDRPALADTIGAKRLAEIRGVCFAALFVSYFIALLAYYPGNFAYDITIQTDQALGIEKITKFHPPLHTFIWGLCIRIGKILSVLPGTPDVPEGGYGIEGGMFAYGLLQLSLLAFVLSGVVVRLSRRRTGKLFAPAVFLVFLLSPTIRLFSFAITKDALFAIFFVWFIMMLTDEEYGAPMIAVGVITLLLRNNAVYAFAILLVLLVKDELKGGRKRVRGKTVSKSMLAIRSIAIAVLISVIISGPVYSLIGIEKGDVREALALPMQQIAHTVFSDEDGLSSRQREAFAKYADPEKLRANFNPRLADTFKRITYKDAIEGDKKGFLRLWADLMIKHPDNYLSELISLNISSWYLGSDVPDPGTKKRYVETEISDYFAEQPSYRSVFEGEYNRLERFATGEIFGTNAILKVIFSPALVFMILLFASLVIYIRGGRGTEAKLTFLYWLTFLAGPVACMRYVYPILLVLPVILMTALDPWSHSKR